MVARTSLKPNQAADIRPFNCRFAFEPEAQFNEECLHRFKVVNDDENVVHPLKCHDFALIQKGNKGIVFLHYL